MSNILTLYADGIINYLLFTSVIAAVLTSLAADKNMHSPWARIQEPLVKFLETMLDKPKEIQSLAMEVADAYGRYNPDKFREIWEKLKS